MRHVLQFCRIFEVLSQEYLRCYVIFEKDWDFVTIRFKMQGKVKKNPKPRYVICERPQLLIEIYYHVFKKREEPQNQQ